MAQGYKSEGPGDGNNRGSDPNRTRGSTVQGFKRAPTAPFNLRCEVKSQQETLVLWTLPPSQGITSVNVQLLKYENSDWKKIDEVDVDARSTQAVTVLGPVKNHAVQVRAVNSFGSGDAAHIRLG